MKRLLRYIFILITTLFLMSHNAYAVEQAVNFNHSTPISNVAIGNCSNFQARILNPNADTSYNIDSLCFSTVIADQVTAGQFVTISFILGNIQDSNALDARFRNIRGDTSVFDLVDVKSYDAGNSSAIIDVTLFAKGTYTSQYFGLYRISTTGGAITLQPNEELVPLQIVVWDNGSAGGGVAPSGDVYTAVTYIHSQLDNMYFQQLTPIKNGVVTINGTTQQIRDLILTLGDKLDDLPQDTADAVTETEKEKVQSETDKSKTGADTAKNDSQQATSSLLSTVTGVFNAIINANATNCEFDSHLPFMSGNGTVDLCAIPAPPIVQGIGSLIALGLFAPFALHMFRRFVSITESFQR